jgi:hypothetical protein
MPCVCVCLYCRLQRRRLARAQPAVRSRRFPSTANSSARGRRSSTQTADCCCSAHDLPTTIDSWHCLAGTHCLPTWLACLRSGHSPLDADRCSLTSGCCCFVAGTRQRFPPRCSVSAVHRLRISTNGWAPNRTMARSELGLARRRMWQRWRTLGVEAAARCVPAFCTARMYTHTTTCAHEKKRDYPAILCCAFPAGYCSVQCTASRA